MSIRQFTSSLALSALFLTMPMLASADIMPPDVAECRSKKVGDACTTDGQKGRCHQTTCSKTLPGPNGPETVNRDCVRCMTKEQIESDQKRKKETSKPLPKKGSAEQGTISRSTALSLAAGAGSLLLGLFMARRFAPRSE